MRDQHRAFPSTPFLDRVAAISPNLTDLYLDIELHTEEAETSLKSMLLRLPMLRVVRLKRVRDGGCVAAALEAHRHLEMLELVSRSTEEGLPEEWTHVQQVLEPFRMLSDLRVGGSQTEGVVAMLETISPHQRLESITFRRPKQHQPHGSRWLNTDLEALTQAFGLHRKLGRIIIRDLNFRILIPKDLLPLADCCALRELDVKIQGVVCITDDSVGSLVSHFPVLRKLTLWRYPGYSSNELLPQNTLRVIGIVASACPLIETIRLDINATDTDFLHEPPIQPYQNLRTISVAHSPIENPLAVATNLSSLSKRQWWLLDPDDQVRQQYVHRWREVNRLVGVQDEDQKLDSWGRTESDSD